MADSQADALTTPEQRAALPDGYSAASEDFRLNRSPAKCRVFVGKSTLPQSFRLADGDEGLHALEGLNAPLAYLLGTTEPG